MGIDERRRWLPALALGLGAEALFAWRLTVPHKLVFDEVHYVPAARTIWSLAAPANIEHPLLGKLLIGLGIAIFGDNPLGWRALSTLAATAVVVGVYAILALLFRRPRTALVGGLFALLNFTVFVQARIAMLDGFMAAFVVWGLALLLWAMHGTPAQVRRRWLGGAVLLGVAVACKWTAAPYVAAAGLAFLWARRRLPARWPGLGAATGAAMLGAASVASYLATFLPTFFYARDALTWSTLLPFQRVMYHQQTQVLPPHTYQSSWWTWPLDIRPIWYLYEPVDGAVRGILMIGNPVVIWGGLIAVAACLWGARRDARLGAVGGLWVFSLAIWALIPKSLGFFYYYYLSSIWLALAIAAAFDHWRARARYWDEAVLLAAAMLFVHFYPILAATALPGPQGFRRWMWFDTWP